jgi:hypothetical protein
LSPHSGPTDDAKAGHSASSPQTAVIKETEMTKTTTTRDRLLGVRVTERELGLLRDYARADQRTVSAMLRKLLAEAVAGFGATKQQRRTENQECAR